MAVSQEATNKVMNRRSFVTRSSVALAGAAIAPTGRAAWAAAAPQRILIDSDPGVDDAFAIFLALTSPEVKVEAITAVAGNVPLSLTLPNALRLVEIAGRKDIPVAAGASVPLVRRLVTATYAHGENGLAGVDFPAPTLKPVAEHAVDLMNRVVSQNPHEVTLVALGPLTNVALALQAYPSLAHQIRSIVMMGGSLSGGNISPAAEFNFYVDPEAASLVFNSGIPITMVGLDVTEQVTFTAEHLALLEQSSTPIGQAAAKIGRRVLESASARSLGGFHMHDPLALSSLLDPGLLTLQDYLIKIETSGSYSAGASYGYKHAPIHGSAPMQYAEATNAPPEPFAPNARVATAVDSARFFQLLIPRLSQSSAVR
jgi:inosine-uridine nucleoside N-ribohydrolase